MIFTVLFEIYRNEPRFNTEFKPFSFFVLLFNEQHFCITENSFPLILIFFYFFTVHNFHFIFIKNLNVKMGNIAKCRLCNNSLPPETNMEKRERTIMCITLPEREVNMF